jgi:uncharacterized membrane protein
VKKYEFLAELERQLDGLAPEDIKASLDYYAEMIDDRVDDGMTEEKAIDSIGTPTEAAARMLEDMPVSKLVRARVKSKKSLGALGITLIIIGSPIWASLAIAALAIIISVAAVAFAAWVSIWSVFVALAGVAVGCTLGFPFVIINNGAGLGIAALGVGLFAGGLAIFTFIGCVALSKRLGRGIVKLLAFIKRKIIRKEAVQ